MTEDWMKREAASIPTEPAKAPAPLDVKALNETMKMAEERVKSMNDRLERGEQLDDSYIDSMLESVHALL